MASFLPPVHTGQLCVGTGLLLMCEHWLPSQTQNFADLSRSLLASEWHPKPVSCLPGCSVWEGDLISVVSGGMMHLPLLNDGLHCAERDNQRLWNFLVPFSCSVPLYHFIPDLFRKLLGLHGCFVGSLCELQLESLYIPEGNYLQVKPLWVPTGWNHFTNFVTFQTNHLHLSWFRAAVAKGLNTYATEINLFFSVNLIYILYAFIFITVEKFV